MVNVMGLSDEKRKKNRNTLGTRLKIARTEADFTQKALADALGLEYYTMVSQMELGYISIPPALWGPIADTLKIDRSAWVLDCLEEISPEIFTSLFGNNPKRIVAEVLTKLRQGAYENGSA